MCTHQSGVLPPGKICPELADWPSSVTSMLTGQLCSFQTIPAPKEWTSACAHWPGMPLPGKLHPKPVDWPSYTTSTLISGAWHFQGIPTPQQWTDHTQTRQACYKPVDWPLCSQPGVLLPGVPHPDPVVWLQKPLQTRPSREQQVLLKLTTAEKNCTEMRTLHSPGTKTNTSYPMNTLRHIYR